MEVNLTQEKIDELETQHKRVAHLVAKDKSWEIVIRRPTRAEYKQFRARSHNASQAPDAQEILIRQCVVYPTRDAFDAMLEEWPAIPEAASQAIRHLTGMAAEEDLK